MPNGFYARGFQFVKRAPVVMTISGILAVSALILVFAKDLNFSTDFTGGSNILLGVSETTTVNDVRGAIDTLDFEGVTGSGATVQEVQDATIEGKEISVRVGLTPGRDDEQPVPGRARRGGVRGICSRRTSSAPR